MTPNQPVQVWTLVTCPCGSQRGLVPIWGLYFLCVGYFFTLRIVIISWIATIPLDKSCPVFMCSRDAAQRPERGQSVQSQLSPLFTAARRSLIILIVVEHPQHLPTDWQLQQRLYVMLINTLCVLPGFMNTSSRTKHKLEDTSPVVLLRAAPLM